MMLTELRHLFVPVFPSARCPPFFTQRSRAVKRNRGSQAQRKHHLSVQSRFFFFHIPSLLPSLFSQPPSFQPNSIRNRTAQRARLAPLSSSLLRQARCPLCWLPCSRTFHNLWFRFIIPTCTPLLKPQDRCPLPIVRYTTIPVSSPPNRISFCFWPTIDNVFAVDTQPIPTPSVAVGRNPHHVMFDPSGTKENKHKRGRIGGRWYTRVASAGLVTANRSSGARPKRIEKKIIKTCWDACPIWKSTGKSEVLIERKTREKEKKG